MASELSRLYQFLLDHYSLGEFHTLCFTLGVKQHDLGGGRSSAQIRQSILLLGRQRRLDELLIAVKENHPQKFRRANLHSNAEYLNRLYAELPASYRISLNSASLWALVQPYLGFIYLTIFAEIALYVTYSWFSNQYLIPEWSWVAAAVLLAISLATGHATRNSTRAVRRRTSLLLISSLLFVALVAWQAYRILFPDLFPSQTLGILVAELGEQPDRGPSAISSGISEHVYWQLCTSLDQAYPNAATNTLCYADDEQPPGRVVQIRQAGYVSDPLVAWKIGRRVGAGLVTWGHVDPLDRSANLHLQLLDNVNETLDSEIPLVIPITLNQADFTINFKGISLEDEPDAYKAIIGPRTAVVSSSILGIVAYLEGDFAGAMEYLKQAISHNEEPTQAMGLLTFTLGKSLLHLDSIHEARMWLEKAHELNPQEPAVLINLAMVHRSLGWQKQMEQSLDEAWELLNAPALSGSPDVSAAVSYDKGLVHALRGEPELAMLQFQQLAFQEPSFTLAHIALGRTLAGMGRLEEAEALLVQTVAAAVERGTDAAIASLELARVRERAGDWDGAKRAYREAIGHDETSTQMRFQYGQFLERGGEVDIAMLTYKAIADTAAAPSIQAQALVAVAQLQARLGMHRPALDSYLQAASISTSPLLQAHLAGFYYDELEDLESARKWFEEAVAHEHTPASVFSSYAAVLAAEEQYPQASLMLEKSLQLAPAGEQELFLLAQAYQMQGKCEEARQALMSVLSLSDQVTVQTTNLAQSQLRSLENCALPP